MFGISAKAPKSMKLKAVLLSTWGCQLRNHFEGLEDDEFDDTCPFGIDCSDCKLRYWNRVQGMPMNKLIDLIFSFEEEDEND